MNRRFAFPVVIAALLINTLACSVSVDLKGATDTPTPQPATLTSTPVPATPTASATPLPSATPTLAAPTATLTPTATPLPPPEEISLDNFTRLNAHAGAGDGALTRLLVSPDSKSLLLATTTTLSLYNLSDLRLLWQVESGPHLVDYAFTPDGGTLVGVSAGGTVYLRDAASGRFLKKTLDRLMGVRYLALSPSGGLVALTDFSGNTTLLDTLSGEQVQRNNGQAYPGGVTGVFISPDESTFVLSGLDSALRAQVQQWHTGSGGFKIGLVGVGPEVARWKYSLDGKRIFGVDTKKLTAQDATALSVWDVTSGGFLKVISRDDLIVDYAPAADGKTVLTATRAGVVKALDVDKGTLINQFADHSAPILGLALSPDSQTAVSLSADGRLIAWRVTDASSLSETSVPELNARANTAFSADGRLALTLDAAAGLRLIDLQSWKTLSQFGAPGARYTALALSSNGSLAAAIDSQGLITVWDAGQGEGLKSFEARTRFVIEKLKFTPNDSLLASLSEGQIILWDVTDGSKWKEFAGAHDFDFAPDNPLLAAGGVDKQVFTADVQSGKKLFSTATDQVTALAYSLDERLIAVGGISLPPASPSFKSRVQIIDSTTRQILPQALEGMPAAVSALAFSPNGQLAAASDRYGNLFLWEAQANGQMVEFVEAVCPPASLKFSPDGTLLYVGGADGVIAYYSTVPQSGAQPAPAAAPAPDLAGIPALDPVPFVHPDGLVTVNLPLDWTPDQINKFSFSATAPDYIGSINFSAIHTGAALNIEQFQLLVDGFEQFYAEHGEQYRKLDGQINSQKGEAFVTRSVQIEGKEYIWETYFIHSDAILYQLNFLSRADLAEALLPLYQQVYASMKPAPSVVLAQPAYALHQRVQDNQQEFSYPYPMGWLREDKLENTLMLSTYKAPDDRAFLVSAVFNIPEGKLIDEALLDQMTADFLQGMTKGYQVLSREKASEKSVKTYFTSQSMQAAGMVVSSALQSRVHLLALVYQDAAKNIYQPMLDDLSADFSYP